MNYVQEKATNGPIIRPSRSLDITQLQYFIWGYLKVILFAKNVEDFDQLN